MAEGTTSARRHECGLRNVARNVFLAFVITEAALFGLDYLLAYRELVDVDDLQRLFNVTLEDTIGTWVSTTQYLLIAGTAWLLYLCRRGDVQGARAARGWALLAGFFTYMSFDDGSRFHERIGSMFGDYAPAAPSEAVASAARGLLEIFPSYNWQLAFFPVFAGMAIFLLVFLYRELKNQDLYTLVVCGLTCWTVAVLLDFLEGSSEAMIYIVPLFDAGYRGTEHLMRAAEECIELFGATLILTAFLAHFAQVAHGWTIGFVGHGAQTAGDSVIADIDRDVDTRQTVTPRPLLADG